ncbi:hypothetical protein LXL04_023081 [Taraxacum kok-saghyz]
MAEIVLSALLTIVLEKLASETLKKIARSKRIGSELKKLKKSVDQIQALLNDASQQEVTNEAVKKWLNGLRHVAYDIDDLLEDLATEAIHRELNGEGGDSTSVVRNLIPNCCTNFSQRTRMHAKLDDITVKLQELVDAKNNLGLRVLPYEKKKFVRNESSLVDERCVVGRKNEKKKMLQKLLGDMDESSSQNFSIVPIVGIGGVGKTTLARLLYDDKEVKDHFELRAWVCVSDEFNIPNISKVIYQSVTGEHREFADLNLLQEALKEKLRNKLFLIVLDDVWSERYDDWDKLVGPFLVAAPGSKIIMTTRKKQLLRKLGFSLQDSLHHLSEEDALSLFAQHALGIDNFDSHPTLKTHGEAFVKKCGGLPLALRTLGRLLRTKNEEEDWKEMLDSKIWMLDNGDEIIPALRLSYNDLSSSLKQLFAYCSLFPKDYMFDKEELILLWMAEGFLHQSTTTTSMGSLGHKYFEELLSRSFFQRLSDDDSLFVMHDLMNDLATYVAGDFFSRLDIEMTKEFRKEASEKHRHMSFVCEFFMGDKTFVQFKGAKNLRTFLALYVGVIESWTTFHLSSKVLNDLLQELPLLRVLSLSHLSISEVPESVGNLKHLRYLNLSNTGITHLAENVCNLYNLQTLIVSSCDKLSKLPESFSKLKNLQHFDIRDTPLLKNMPLGICELKSLRTLSKIIVGAEHVFPITGLKSLINLHGKLSIHGLGNVQNAMEAREANLAQKRLSELELDWGNEFFALRSKTREKEVLNELKPHSDTLKQLKLVSYGGIEFPNWVGDHSFCRLTKVSIVGCEECTSLPRLGQLPSLEELLISGMTNVKVVDEDFLGTALVFRSLKTLHFDAMWGWEVWSTTNSGAVDVVFPCLQKLCIQSCPNLVQVSLEALPSLRRLEVRICGHGVLTSLVHVAPFVTNLQIDDIWGLIDQVWRSVTCYLRVVEEINIWWCREISYLWESEAKASEVLMKLRRLYVGECLKLVSLGEKEEDNCGNNLTSLRILNVSHCNNLEQFSCPDNIESLDISNCDSVRSVSFPRGGQKLKSLNIRCCKKLQERELGGGEDHTRVLINSGMRMIESIHIFNWSNLKSITALSCFINLTSLTIEECQGMASFPDRELPNLTSLTHMVILNCQSMDDSFPRGFWPPKLSFLDIGCLKKPISKWGPQNFPTSFVNLRLHGRPCEEDEGLVEEAPIGPTSPILPASSQISNHKFNVKPSNKGLKVDGCNEFEIKSSK